MANFIHHRTHSRAPTYGRTLVGAALIFGFGSCLLGCGNERASQANKAGQRTHAVHHEQRVVPSSRQALIADD